MNLIANDPSSPLFLNPSDNPGTTLVSQTFDGTGFGPWKRAMIIALSAKNKLGFVDGSCMKPDSNSLDLQQWIRCNNMVISWLLNSLTKEISESVLYSNTASEIWAELEERYGQSNGAELYEIQKELSQISQAASSIAAYYTRIKKLWDRVQSLRVLPSCSCGTVTVLLKFEEEQKLIQFLMGLNERYTTIQGNILMMKPLPSVAQAYSLLIQEEKQREIYSNSQIMIESASMNVGNSYNFQRGGHSFQRGRGDGKKNNLMCDFCKKPGHTKERCFKLHGYPAGYKGSKEKKFAVQFQAEITEMKTSNDTTSVTHIPELTKDQYAKLLQLLNQSTEGESSTQFTGSANFAGPFSEDASGNW